METLANNPKISLISRMNAFYGIPNMSIETSMAIDQGMQPPEVYSSKAREEQETLQRGSGNENSPQSDFYSQATDIVEISRQASSLQQQDSTSPILFQDNNSPLTAAYQPEANQPSSSVYNSERPITGSVRNINTEDNQPTAASSLNGGMQTTGSDRQDLLQSPLRAASQYPLIIAGLGEDSATSISSQPGAIFSALG